MMEITQHKWDICTCNLWSSILLAGNPYLQICISRELGGWRPTPDQLSEACSRPPEEIMTDQMQILEPAGRCPWFSYSGHRTQQSPPEGQSAPHPIALTWDDILKNLPACSAVHLPGPRFLPLQLVACLLNPRVVPLGQVWTIKLLMHCSAAVQTTGTWTQTQKHADARSSCNYP